MKPTQASLATMHGKLDQIAPVFSEILGWELLLADIDTDKFGSFDGLTPRTLTPRDAAIAKAKAGAEHLGTRFGLASEGTIGSHPAYPFMTSDIELIALVDVENDKVLVASHVSPNIVAFKGELDPSTDLQSIFLKCDLPNHAVNILAMIDSKKEISKGIRDQEQLEEIVEAAWRSGASQILVESDFRAMSSPSRQGNIIECAKKLAARVAAQCPACSYFGWGVTSYEFGARCIDCGFENQQVAKREILGCISCSHQERGAVLTASVSAAQCQLCNP